MSYLTDLPSKVLGSLGLTKVMTGLASGRDRRMWPDEWNRLVDYVIAACKSIGIAGSTDEDSHEYRINRLEEHNAGYREDFVHRSGLGVDSLFVDMVNGAPEGYTPIADAVGVYFQTTNAGLDTGAQGQDAHFNMQTTKAKVRFRLTALPGTDGDYIQIGLRIGANDWVLFHSVRGAVAPGAWPPWTCEIMSGGVSQGSATLTAVPIINEWHTFKMTTTPTGVTFVYDEGQVTEEPQEVVGVPTNGMCDQWTAVNSFVGGGEVIYHDYLECHDTRDHK